MARRSPSGGGGRRVAVIGAGIAGLSAARALQDRGDEVVVFERSNIAGGRVATKTVANVELPARGTIDLSFDHGAQYFTVHDPGFSETVAYWLRDRIVSKWSGRIVAFDGEGWEDVEEGTVRYVGVPGMSAIAGQMARGLDVRYGTRVDALDRLGAFDRIIVAVPAEQAAPLLATVPDLAARVASVRMQPCWAVMAAFVDRVAARFDGAFVTGSPLGWIARNQSKPKRGQVDTWVLHATTAWSAAHLDDQADVVAPFLLQSFDDLVRAGLPRVFHFSAHRWKHATADPGLSVGALHDRTGRVSVCGDWCLGPRIESAFLSGLAAADQTIARL